MQGEGGSGSKRTGDDRLQVLDATSVLDSVIAHAFQAGLALQTVRGGGPEAAAGVDHALGHLEEIVRQVRDLAFQHPSADPPPPS